jgi:hypothetical protein
MTRSSAVCRRIVEDESLDQAAALCKNVRTSRKCRGKGITKKKLAQYLCSHHSDSVYSHYALPRSVPFPFSVAYTRPVLFTPEIHASRNSSLSGSAASTAFGPALPAAFGPALPAAFGPALPAASTAFGPALPAAFGPALPAAFGPALPAAFGPALPAASTAFGPALPAASSLTQAAPSLVAGAAGGQPVRAGSFSLGTGSQHVGTGSQHVGTGSPSLGAYNPFSDASGPSLTANGSSSSKLTNASAKPTKTSAQAASTSVQEIPLLAPRTPYTKFVAQEIATLLTVDSNMASGIEFLNIDLFVCQGMPICVPMKVVDSTIAVQAFLLDDSSILRLVEEWGKVVNVVVTIGDVEAQPIVNDAYSQSKIKLVANRDVVVDVLTKNYKLLTVAKKKNDSLGGKNIDLIKDNNASHSLFFQFLVTLSGPERHILLYPKHARTQQKLENKKVSAYLTYVANILRSKAVAATEPDYMKNVADELSSYFLYESPYVMVKSLTSHSFSVLVRAQHEMQKGVNAFIEALVEWAVQYDTIVHMSRHRDATRRLQGEITVFTEFSPLPEGIDAFNVYGEDMTTRMTSDLGYLEICCDFRNGSQTFNEFVSGISGEGTKQSFADFLTTQYLTCVRAGSASGVWLAVTSKFTKNNAERDVRDHVQLTRHCWQRRVLLSGRRTGTAEQHADAEMTRFQLLALNALQLNKKNSSLIAMPLFAAISDAPYKTPGLLIGYVLDTVVDDLTKALRLLGVAVISQNINKDNCGDIAPESQYKIFISKHMPSDSRDTRICPDIEEWSLDVSWPQSAEKVLLQPRVAAQYGTMRLYVKAPNSFTACLILVQMALGSLVAEGLRTQTLS